MRNYFYHLKLLLNRLLLVFVFMTLTRLLFYFMNSNHFGQLSVAQILMHMIYGWHFDMVSIFLANLLFIILSVIPGSVLNKNFYQQILKWVYIPINLILIAVNLIDCKFYEFQDKRLTWDIFNPQWLGDDFITLLPSFITDYWYLFVLFILLAIVWVIIYPKNKKYNHSSTDHSGIIIRQSLIALLIVSLSGVAGRGTLKLKPLRIISATRYTTPNRIPLVLNSSFTLIKTYGENNVNPVHYFSEVKLPTIFDPVHQYQSEKPFQAKNVVIIIMESFSREYSALLNGTNVGYTPCLDSIMKLGIYCTNGYANGKRSIEAMPSVISSIPAIMSDPFITSSFTSNQIEGIGRLLKPYGYNSAFFHGGKNGTMGFDNFARLSGFEKYYGLNEYNNPTDYDGLWGVPDEPYFNFVVNEVSTFKEPFVVGIFTISSHHPYFIPAKYAGKFPKGKLVNHESIGYADFALGQFFKHAARQAWFNNTLFVITADHTAQSAIPFFKTNVGHYAVPIVFYSPGDSLLNGSIPFTVQQIDIVPSILDYLNFSKPFVAFGSSIFDSIQPHFAISYLNGLYQLITDDQTILFDGHQVTSAYKIETDSLVPVSIDSTKNRELIRDENLLKAIIQQYNNRMISNKMTVR